MALPTKTVTATVEAIGLKGDGLTHIDGKRVFVETAAAGDVAELELLSDTDEGTHARIVKLVTPSPDRTTPPCPHFEQCGGCSLQHLNAEAYLALKTRMVVEPLERRGIHKTLDGHFITPPHTRRRATLVARYQSGKLVLGYHMRRSHTVVDVQTCTILHPALEAHLPALRHTLADLIAIGNSATVQLTHSPNGSDILLTLPTKHLTAPQRKALQQFAAAENLSRLSWTPEDITEKPEALAVLKTPKQVFAGVEIIPQPAGFLQASIDAETFMTETLLKHLPKRAKTVADLFCGSGTFTFPLAKRAKVLAVESDSTALKTLQEGSKNAGMADRIKTEARNLFHEPLSTLELNQFDAVVFDPPRAGANAQAQQMAKSNVPLLLAISCNPQTFAKDAETLTRGGYKLDKLYMVDQFLWSTHVEVMAVFTR